ncbi:hypothetical protein [Heyndrickxia sporothermodurans]|uniref:hypothetical protein n=1 Tax=Heyndrickxia sporothermodurans TaxID=46224 RepID=UPI002E20B34D|nr:hypothetical protein [Heyndrickxia sporothermodurans]
MPRPKLPDYLLKTPRSVRLPNWMWDELEKRGKVNQEIEKILELYLSIIKKSDNNNEI